MRDRTPHNAGSFLQHGVRVWAWDLLQRPRPHSPWNGEKNQTWLIYKMLMNLKQPEQRTNQVNIMLSRFYPECTAEVYRRQVLVLKTRKRNLAAVQRVKERVEPGPRHSRWLLFSESVTDAVGMLWECCGNAFWTDRTEGFVCLVFICAPFFCPRALTSLLSPLL